MNEQDPKPEGGGTSDPTETRGEPEPREAPRIYVASLSDYNAGRLHGAWVEAAAEPEELAQAIQAMLTASPTPGAEEWAIHDYEGFGPLRLSEYESMSAVSAVARGIAQHGESFAHWADLIGSNDPDELSHFEDAYLGRWESLEAYADELLDDLGVRDELERAVPDMLSPYVSIDVEGFARDLELSGDVTTSRGSEGVYIFDMSR
jgi:antirestriction protein